MFLVLHEFCDFIQQPIIQHTAGVPGDERAVGMILHTWEPDLDGGWFGRHGGFRLVGGGGKVALEDALHFLDPLLALVSRVAGRHDAL